MQVGIFLKVGDELRGTVHTVTQSFELVFVPIGAEYRTKTGASHIIKAGAVEVGGAWPKRPGDLSCLKTKFDDPTFKAPMLGEMTETKPGEYVMVWNRPAWRR